MPSSYTTSLRLTLPATGELAGQWGNTVNTGITELLDAAVAGTTTISTWGGAGVAYTLSNNSGTADEARRMFIVATGTPGEAKNVICPAVSKFYVFRNDTTGGFALTLKTSGGTGIAVPAGQYKFLYCDGTNVVEMFNSAGALTLSGALSVGGTTTLAANPTLSAGTANQVQFLNASKVLVGSANLTFNGTDLTVSGAVNAGTVNATTLDLTNLEVTNIKAKDGTASASIADSTGVMSLVANPVFSGGTANGVLYLDGSKVATSGSALTFDGSNLGIGTSSPAYKLDVAGSARFTNGEFLYFNNSSGTAKTVLGYFSDNNTYLDAADGAIIMRTGSGTVERMRLDSSGNLGIGTSSPGARLDVNGNVNLISTARLGYLAQTDTSTVAGVTVPNYGIGWGSYTDMGGIGLGLFGYYGILFSTAGIERIRLDSSGNLGLGVTPSAWLGAGYIDFPGNGYVGNAASYSGNTLSTGLNAYYGTGNWRYKQSSLAASRFDHTNGAFAWYTAPSGTAGNTISFTQAMTLDASGQLLVGHTAALGGLTREVLVNTASGSAGINFSVAASLTGRIRSESTSTEIGTVNSAPLIFNTANSERARITSGGDLLVGLTTSQGKVGINQSLSGTYGSAGIWLTDNATTSLMFNNVSSGVSAIWSSGALTFGTGANNNTERARITSEGNLGVGTTSPTNYGAAYKTIAVNGASGGMFEFQVAGSSAGYMTADASALSILAGGSRVLNFYTNGNERARITSDGYFGIGTTPTSQFYVSGGGALATRTTTLESTATASTSLPVLRFNRTTTNASANQWVGLIDFDRNLTDGSLEKTANILVIGNNNAGSSDAYMYYRALTGHYFQTGTSGAPSLKATLTSDGNFKIGSTSNRATTEGTNQLVLFNGTAPAGTLTNGVSIYSSSGEAYVMDAAGNATLFSPHDKETNEWIFKSKHTPTGKVLRIDVEKLLRFVNDHFGLDAVQEFIEQP